MGFKTLITLNGTAPYDEDEYFFEVIEGGALRIVGGDGVADLIGPGFWVAVIDANSDKRHDWEFLAPQQPAD